MKALYLTTKSQKNEYLRHTHLSHAKIYTQEELECIFPYQYNRHTLDYIISNYHVILEIAELYLKQITHYEVEKIKTEKGIFLTKLKNDLIKKDLLNENKLFRHYLAQQDIFITLPYTKDLLSFFAPFQVTFLKNEKQNYQPTIYELTDTTKEINLIGEKIALLLNTGISPDKIFIANIPNDFRVTLERTFNLLHLPFELINKTTLKETYLGNKFLTLLETMEDVKALEILKNEIETEKERELYNKLVTICNQNIDLENKKLFITKDLSTIKAPHQNMRNCIQEVTLLDRFFLEDDYVFIMNAISSEFPKTLKDEDYFSDQIKTQLGMDTSKDLNILTKKRTTEMIKSIKNCFITIPLEYQKKEAYPSAVLDSWLSNKITTAQLSFQISADFNKFFLAQELDTYTKYNTLTKDLMILDSNYQIPYRTYNNQFTSISKDLLLQRLNNQLTLSYTSLDLFNKCPFRYYLTYILKLTNKQDDFALMIGNLFHEGLEAFYHHLAWEDVFTNVTKNHAFSSKEQFFLEKLKNDFKDLLITLQKQDSYCSLDNVLTEELVQVNICEQPKIIFTGKIDKLKYKEVSNQTILAITDYKTGNASILPEYIPLGFHLQLPSYIYLAKHHSKFKNPIIGGIYFQKIILERLKKDELKSFETIRQNALKLHGYSTNNQDILKEVDHNFADSLVIAGLKTKIDGSFYSYSKVLNESDFAKLEEIVATKIKTGAKDILNGNFPIQSIIIDNKDHISCDFCPFQDICFKKPNDFIYLQSDKSFLRKEEENERNERTITSD